ncbi:D-alanyl-D-alanine carboxypeptidase family protein [Nocardia otitidiscaviarum]|uniref:D-alanyl-D-alanine carboxypeptidase family protein n=1 Tax=Nocardia otitidiscaviarum TaxID=1823 RepID=UPI001893BB27|nr:D-alanyl-D-alanine carboxypeptidase family protein [Nocardia otitidiscaviarum]MBF6237074.1 D-alanyl-D-alanine carboxypeptidase family protein [Nocardia otitidiscaviarum]
MSPRPVTRRLAVLGLFAALASIVVACGESTEADGGLPRDATVFDDRYPGVANLSPDLLRALRRAAADAAADGVTFTVNSGWRSPDYQNRLLSEAVTKYGSRSAAARWVATAETSPHVSGDAVDLASDAATWLAAHGAGYGLCQIYANEPWHYELRPEAIHGGCVPMYPDPAHDPRMRR